MKRLLLPFFLVRLVLSLVPFLVQVLLLAATPYLGFGLTLVIVFLYGVLFTRHLLLIKLDQSKTALPSPTLLSAWSQQLQQRIVSGFNHRLFYRDDPELTIQHDQIQNLLKTAPTHRDLLLNQAILAEVHPELAPAGVSSTSAYQQAKYSDPNFSLLKE